MVANNKTKNTPKAAVVKYKGAKKIDPTNSDGNTPLEVKERINNMLTFISTLTDWFDQVRTLPKPTLVALMKMGSAVGRFVGGSKSRSRGVSRG